MLAPKAKARQSEHGNTAPGRKSENTSSKLDEVKPPAASATRKVGAIGTGYSGSTLDKVDRIRDAAGGHRQGADTLRRFLTS